MGTGEEGVEWAQNNKTNSNIILLQKEKNIPRRRNICVLCIRTMTTTTNKQTFPPLLCEEILLLLRYCSLYSLLMGCSTAKLTDVLSFLLFPYKDTIAPKYTHLSKNFTHKFYFVCIILLFSLPLLTLPTRQSRRRLLLCTQRKFP